MNLFGKKVTQFSELQNIPDNAILYIVYNGIDYKVTKANLLAGLSGGGGTTPTLQEVTDAGTVTTNDVQVAGIVLTDLTSLVGDIQIINSGAFELFVNTNSGVKPLLNLALGQIEVSSLNGKTVSIFTNTNGDSQLLAPVTTGIETIATESYVDFIASQFATTSQVVNVLKHNVTPNTLTASANTTETVLDNYDLGVGFLSNYDRLVIECNIIKNVAVNGGAQTFFYLSKVANSIAVGDAVKIATSTAIASGGGIGFFKRGLWRLNNKLYTKHPVTIANSNEEANANNIPVVALDDADIHNYRYLVVTSTYIGTGFPNTMQNNILVYKYPSI
jgi:hypothetical protein